MAAQSRWATTAWSLLVSSVAEASTLRWVRSRSECTLGTLSSTLGRVSPYQSTRTLASHGRRSGTTTQSRGWHTGRIQSAPRISSTSSWVLRPLLRQTATCRSTRRPASSRTSLWTFAKTMKGTGARRTSASGKWHAPCTSLTSLHFELVTRRTRTRQTQWAAVHLRWRTWKWCRPTRSSLTSWVRTPSATRTLWTSTKRCTPTWRR
mmetsp:Transcript_27117/g.59220  ORF Transcript_27117/g.59220 Transcript_27117/m.59220 type:complete len:207 (+) Transcript_27117:944-1564(+)